jgi:hypothetical protein
MTPCRIAAFTALVALGMGAAQAPATRPAAAAAIEAAIDKEGLDATRPKLEAIHARPDDYAISERDINTLGYRYLQRNAFQEAIAVFEFNVRRFPDSFNVYDSLAEACFAAGDMARAEATHKAWAAKFPNDANVARRLAEFPLLAKRYENERRNTLKPGQPTGLQGPYLGQEPPGTTPKRFAEGVISLAATSDYACSWSPDGKEFYFTHGGSPQVIMVSRLGPGGWTFPEPVTFSAGFSAHEPHVTYDNKRVFWGWFRQPPGEPTMERPYGIFMAERTPTGWSEAKYVGQGMYVSSTRDGRLFLTENSNEGGFLAEVTMTNGRFNAPVRLRGGMDALRPSVTRLTAHPALAPDGSYVVFDVGGGPHLYVCFRNPDGTWGEAIDLAKHGLPPDGGIAKVSPDGKYLFYGAGGDIYWVSTKLIEDLRPGGARK